MKRRGSIMMEAVMVLPLLVMLIFAVLQFSAIVVAREMTEYAAYCACRAALTSNFGRRFDRGKDAACRVLAPLSLSTSGGGAAEYIYYPGWGKLGKAGDIANQVKVSYDLVGTLADFVSCQVKFKYPLIMPIPGFERSQKYIELEGRAVLPLPYDTTVYPILSL